MTTTGCRVGLWTPSSFTLCTLATGMMPFPSLRHSCRAHHSFEIWAICIHSRLCLIFQLRHRYFSHPYRIHKIHQCQIIRHHVEEAAKPQAYLTGLRPKAALAGQCLDCPYPQAHCTSAYHFGCTSADAYQPVSTSFQHQRDSKLTT